MASFFKKPLVAIILVVIVLGLGLFAVQILRSSRVPAPTPPVVVDRGPKQEKVGTSVEGRDITAYIYGTGPKHVAFVGGIHGGYEWNSVLLAYEFLDYLDAHPDFVPADMTISVIPSANPDGVFKVIKKEGRFTLADVPTTKDDKANMAAGLGRFNAHGVDLNRNFACKWKPESMWRSKKVSAGTEAFSEPEAQAIKNFVEKYSPAAMVFWHSQSNAVYASQCEDGILPSTLDVMNAYASAADYPAVKEFDAYEISGDAEGWLASIGIPAITVELKTHETIEWEKNLAGIKALVGYFSTR